MQEAIAPQAIEDVFEQQHLVGLGQRAVAGQVQRGLHLVGILLEQLEDNRVFIREVVIQIARAHAQCGRQMIGGNQAFALLIEQGEALYQDAITRFHEVGMS